MTEVSTRSSPAKEYTECAAGRSYGGARLFVCLAMRAILLRGHSALVASLLVGLPWAAFHLPLHLPGHWYAEIPITATLLILLAYSVLLTWIFVHTRGSVLMTTLFHGTRNAVTPLTAGIDLELAWWLRAAGFSAIVLIVVLVTGPNLGGRRRCRERPPTQWRMSPS